LVRAAQGSAPGRLFYSGADPPTHAQDGVPIAQISDLDEEANRQTVLTRLHGPALLAAILASIAAGCLLSLVLMRVFSTLVGAAGVAGFAALSLLAWRNAPPQAQPAPVRSRP